MQISFLGAAGTVTGSRYLIQADQRPILLDCGLFQGLKQLRLRNWAPFPVDPSSIAATVMTHAHLDHSGYLPALVRDGFSGQVYCSSATKDLCEILLLDSAYLQEQDAEYANRHKFSKHKPALPLYTIPDAERALARLASVPFDKDHVVGQSASIRLRHAGHILGAAIVEFTWQGRKIVFSGDLGRYGDPTMLDPTPIEAADYLVIESTYGNRRHDTRDPQEVLLEIVERTVKRGGTLVIPAFAVGRAQALLFHLYKLKMAGRLPDVPIYLNSPMAIDASDILCRHIEDQKLSADECVDSCKIATYVRSVEASKALNNNAMPKIIISAAGMATGGRVLHHLKRFAPDHRNTILFSGFQAAGTRGAAMLGGAETIKIHGEHIPVRAEVDNLPMLSAHADAEELLRWLRGFRRPPRMTFITHGEPTAADVLRRRIQDELGWSCKVPEHLEKVELP